MLKNNERILLYLISKFETVSRIKLVKIMFLLSQEYKQYDFLPYQYGPFSFQMYHDLSRLDHGGYVNQKKEIVKQCGKKFKMPGFFIKNKIDVFACQLGKMTDKELLDRIYNEYPEYSIFSRYKKKMKYVRDEKGIVTIGYEGKSIDRVIHELIINKVQILVDVRKNAFSRKFGFSKSRLSDYPSRVGIEYEHIPEFGIESSKRKKLETSEDYTRLFREYSEGLESKQKYLDKIKNLGQEKKVALMCFENNVDYCHRGVIAERLREDEVEVEDI